MAVALLESETIERLESTLDKATRLIETLSKENKKLKDCRTSSLEEAAFILKCAPKTVLAKKNEFDIAPTGKTIVIWTDSIYKYLEKRTIRAKK